MADDDKMFEAAIGAVWDAAVDAAHPHLTDPNDFYEMAHWADLTDDQRASARAGLTLVVHGIVTGARRAAVDNRRETSG